MSKKIIQCCVVASLILNFSCGDSDLITNENPNTSTYTVGGSVTGLDGDLILQLNNNEMLSIDGDQSFRFNKKFDKNDEYLVEILESPFTQNCSINNATGEIRSANVSNVSIICSDKVWIQPSITDSISPNTPGYFPKVANDNNGNIIIVWAQFDGTFSQIYKSEFRNGVWTHPTNVDDNISPNTNGVIDPRVAMDDHGNAIIVWTQSDGSYTRVFKSEYRNGAWTHPANQQDHIGLGVENANEARVAMDNNGNAIITWSQSDGNLPQVFKSEYRNGAWIHPANLSDNISIDNQIGSDAKPVMSDNGDAMIVWQQFTGVNVHVFKSEFRNGIWTNPTDFSDHVSPDGGNAFDPHPAMDDHGNAIISWTQSNTVNLQIFKAEYRNNLWSVPADLNDNISPDNFSADNSRVMMNNDSAVIAWTQSNGVNTQIFKSNKRDGDWTHPASISDNVSLDGQNTTDPSVDMDGQGNAILAWIQSDGTNMQLFQSTYHNGGWDNPATLSDNISADGQDVFHHSLSMNDSGAAVIVWSQYDSTNSRIFKSQY